MDSYLGWIEKKEGSNAYLRPLYTIKYMSLQAQAIDTSLDNLQKQIPPHGLVIWSGAPNEATEETLWSFNIRRINIIDSAYTALSPILLPEIIDMQKHNKKYYINTLKEVKEIIISYIPSKDVYLQIDKNLLAGPITLTQQMHSSHNHSWSLNYQAAGQFLPIYYLQADRFLSLPSTPNRLFLPPWMKLNTYYSYVNLYQDRFIETSPSDREIMRKSQNKTIKRVHQTLGMSLKQIAPQMNIILSEKDTMLYSTPQPTKTAGTSQLLGFSGVDGAKLECIALQNLSFKVQVAQNSVSPLIPLHTIQAEAIRVALWMHSLEGTQSVHINRLLRAAQRLMRPIWQNREKAKPEDFQLSPGNEDIDTGAAEGENVRLDERLYRLHRDALDELKLIGDIVELPQGYWLPAPLRIIQLRTSQRQLVVGGLPTMHFPSTLKKYIEYNHFARFYVGNPDMVETQWARQTTMDWYHVPKEQEDVRAWAEHLLYDTILQTSYTFDYAYELYIPNKTAKQSARWTSEVHPSTNGRYLARLRSRIGLNHWIVEVERGKIVAAGEIEHVDYQRLCYGLDALKGYSVKVAVKRAGDMYTFEMGNELPQAELRLFTALGHLQSSPHDNPSLRTWQIPIAYVKEAQTALKRLHIQIPSI